MAVIVHAGGRQQVADGLVLGRWRGCGLQVRDEKASRKHARLLKDGEGAWWIEDLGSANGTEVNGQRLGEKRRLKHGDRIAIGRTTLVVELDEAESSSAELPAVEAPDAADDARKLVGAAVGGCRIAAVIGVGARGAVYRAKQLATGREVAVKILPPDIADGALTRIRKVSAIAHDALAGLHDCGRDDGRAWCSMELVDGDNLERIVERDGRLDADLAALVGERVAQALEAAHAAGVAHGDVNPRTVLLDRKGRVKLVDLGIAAASPGDPAYATPDRALGREPTPADDVYALGGTLWHLLTGSPPYDADDPEELARAHRERPLPDPRAARPDLPKEAVDLLTGLLNKNPEWRYASMREVLVDLEKLRKALAAAAKPPARKASSDALPAARAARKGSSDGLPAARPRRPRTEPVSPVAQADARVHRMAMRFLVGLAVALVAASAAPVIARHLSRGDQPPQAVAVGATAAGPTTGGAATRPTTGQATGSAATAPTAGPLDERWRAVQAAIAKDVAVDAWGAAERRLASFLASAAAGDVLDAARLRARQLQLDGQAWYRGKIAALPALDEDGALPKAGAALSRLRDVALAHDRPDAESRYQEVLTRLNQRLSAARRDARRAVESGQFADPPRIADALAASFAGTPVEGLQRQFAAAAREAAAAAPRWAGSWDATRVAFMATHGVDALPPAAALILHGDVAEAKALLAREPALASGDALRRRERLLGREAAVLAFDDPSDLQFIESLDGGDLVLADGALTARGDAAGVACTVPVGGATWDVSATFHLGAGDGAAVWSICQGDTAHLLLRLERERATLRVHAGDGWIEQQPERPTGESFKVRFACRDGTVSVTLGDLVLIEAPQSRIPVGSQVRFEAAGVKWRLDDLQVVGGE